MKIVLPFPSSLLSGHAKGNAQWAKIKATKEHRKAAHDAVTDVPEHDRPLFAESGDIAITFRFTPPDNRGDRLNFPARIKPYADGIADALKVNDRRFVPHFEFLAAAKPGSVEVLL